MSQAARRESTVGEISTLLGEGSEFEGKLTFEGTVRIDGVLKGEVFSDDVLIIGEGARVEAEIDVGEIIIQGLVTGNIRATRSIELLAPGRITGDLTTPNLLIEKGAIFEGRSHMADAAGKPGASTASASPSTPEASSGGPKAPSGGPKAL
jgi:cytoskeletal protein CcmA (bactofilin family)